MKKVSIILLLFIPFSMKQGFSQNNTGNHFEIDAMFSMHHYSSSFLQAANSVTRVQDPADGYGTSILPSIQISYFFKNNIGITAGIVPITAENDLYVDNASSQH